MATKREAQGDVYSDAKRPRYGGPRDHHPSDNHYNHHGQQQRPRFNPAYQQHIPKEIRDHARSASSTVPAAQDPAASLEGLLKSLTSNPDTVRSVLGSNALESANQLLSSLQSRDKTATASLDLFKPPTIEHPSVHAYTTTTPLQPYPLPALPSIPPGPYSQATFTHKSMTTHDRVTAAADLNYEKLEFLGDAYIEIIATRLIYARYPELPAGRQAQARERLVKNETLAQFAALYDFRSRLHASDLAHAGHKGTTKILADVFEAYVAAVVLSDQVHGFARAETWLTELWAPILLSFLGPGPGESSSVQYNANAKQELQQKILAQDVKLEYLEDRPMEQSKHIQKYFVGLYLTGYGHEKKKLGYGEGRNKVEAGNRAAMAALEHEAGLIADAAAKLAASKEVKRIQKEQREQQQYEAAAAATATATAIAAASGAHGGASVAQTISE